MNIPIDVVIKIIAYVDADAPCMTITWSRVCKRLWNIFHQTSRDWRLSRRGMWTRFFVLHKDKVEWSLFLNSRVLPFQLERLCKYWQGHRSLKKCVWNVRRAPFWQIMRELPDLITVPSLLEYLACRNLTEEEWEQLASAGCYVPIGYSRLQSAEWMLARREHITISITQNENISDDVAAEFMDIFADERRHTSSHRSDEFYAKYPHALNRWHFTRPVSWWQARPFTHEWSEYPNIPPQVVMDHIHAWTDKEYKRIFEHVQMDISWLRKLDAIRSIPRARTLYLQPLEWFGDCANEDEIVRVCGNPNITPEWIEKNVLPLKYPRECWEEITCNWFGLSEMMI